MDSALILWLAKNKETMKGQNLLRSINKIELDKKLTDCIIDLADLQRALEEPAYNCDVIQLFGASS